MADGISEQELIKGLKGKARQDFVLATPAARAKIMDAMTARLTIQRAGDEKESQAAAKRESLGSGAMGIEKVAAKVEKGNDKVAAKVEKGEDKVAATVVSSRDRIAAEIQLAAEKIKTNADTGNRSILGGIWDLIKLTHKSNDSLDDIQDATDKARHEASRSRKQGDAAPVKKKGDDVKFFAGIGGGLGGHPGAHGLASSLLGFAGAEGTLGGLAAKGFSMLFSPMGLAALAAGAAGADFLNWANQNHKDLINHPLDAAAEWGTDVLGKSIKKTTAGKAYTATREAGGSQAHALASGAYAGAEKLTKTAAKAAPGALTKLGTTVGDFFLGDNAVENWLATDPRRKGQKFKTLQEVQKENHDRIWGPTPSPSTAKVTELPSHQLPQGLSKSRMLGSTASTPSADIAKLTGAQAATVPDTGRVDEARARDATVVATEQATLGLQTSGVGAGIGSMNAAVGGETVGAARLGVTAPPAPGTGGAYEVPSHSKKMPKWAQQGGAPGGEKMGGGSGGRAGAKFTGSQKQFYDKAYTTVLAEAKKQGVANPEAIARLGAAQAANESGYGKHAPNNNYFGIKGTGGARGALGTREFINGKWTTQQASFRGYGSFEESASDYVKFLRTNKRYAPVLAATTPEAAIAAQAKTGYATDPNYGGKLAAINKGGTSGGLSNAGESKTSGFEEAKNASNIPGAPGSAAAAVDKASAMVGENLAVNKSDIMNYMKKGGVGMDPSKAAWCAAFVNASLEQSGGHGTGSLAAGSFMNWGRGLNEGENVKKGDVLVTKGMSPRTGIEGKHVALATGNVRNGPNGTQYEVVAGNSGGGVKKYWESANSVHVRRAAEENLPKPAEVAKAATQSGARSELAMQIDTSGKKKHPWTSAKGVVGPAMAAHQKMMEDMSPKGKERLAKSEAAYNAKVGKQAPAAATPKDATPATDAGPTTPSAPAAMPADATPAAAPPEQATAAAPAQAAVGGQMGGVDIGSMITGMMGGMGGRGGGRGIGGIIGMIAPMLGGLLGPLLGGMMGGGAQAAQVPSPMQRPAGALAPTPTPAPPQTRGMGAAGQGAPSAPMGSHGDPTSSTGMNPFAHWLPFFQQAINDSTGAKANFGVHTRPPPGPIGSYGQ